MHVLYLHQYFVSPDAAGGTRSYEMARRLVTAGHRVTLVTSSAFIPDHYVSSRGNKVSLDGIDLVIAKVPYGNRMSFSRRGRAFLEFALKAAFEAARVKEVDVVFATSTPLTIAVPGLVASMAKRRPMVFEVRDLWPELPIAMGALRSPVAIKAAQVLERAAYASAAHVIALSPGMKEGVCRTGYDPSRVTVIPNACDVELFRVGPEEGERFLERHPRLREGPLVVYAGTLGQINGVGALVEIAAAMVGRYPEVRFLIAGDGAERERVLEKASRLGVLERNLFWIPPLAKSEMPGLLAASSVACSLFVDLPEMWNNSANKFFDALAASRPILINYRGWQAEILNRTGAGLVVPPGDPVAAAELLARFLRDGDRMARARTAAGRLADVEFNRERLAGEFISVLERVAAGRARSRSAERREAKR